ncbi:MAG: ApaLI family restriction endonuclease [Cytophagales bacterium]|nr:MAG: ApaLI family restriction endonuclease [Cytophagales bacterium]
MELFESILAVEPDVDTYFECLAALYKRRLKYAKILQYQPIPTMSQVGPRGLLQYGVLSDKALVTLLFWRKWFFDIDNRAGQETGYIFEPIVARCIGGQSISASKSPVRRTSDVNKGRQVDCIVGNDAYEIKLRITIAASGQGRWGEEKTFPEDCKNSGFRPILLVFDGTQANKLDELTAIFIKCGGEVKTGEGAWAHLESMAGPAISVFLEKYVKEPLKNLLESAPSREDLPSLSLHQTDTTIQIVIGDEAVTINRPMKEEDIISDEGN